MTGKKLQSFLAYDRMVNELPKRFMTGEEWIIEVRKVVTTANPHITVGELYLMFDCGAETMDVLHSAYHHGKTPQEAYDLMVQQFGKPK